MQSYENSIKCKYCRYFEKGVNRCHLYCGGYDHSIDDEDDGTYLKETSPESRCSEFKLPGICYLGGMVGHQRNDGTYFVELESIPELKSKLEQEEAKSKSSGGCYIATCVYGSYDCPSVWTLRRYRDKVLAKTWYGCVFIAVYYKVAPVLVRWFGGAQWFKELCRKRLDQLVKHLENEGFENTPYQDKNW